MCGRDHFAADPPLQCCDFFDAQIDLLGRKLGWSNIHFDIDFLTLAAFTIHLQLPVQIPTPHRMPRIDSAEAVDSFCGKDGAGGPRSWIKEFAEGVSAARNQ
jgi:hypothetical protein